MATKATVTFHGGVGNPTGSNFLFETEEGTKILVDCGFLQGSKIAEDANRNAFAYDPASITALFITHAHIDHVGRIPLLVKAGFKGKIYSTPPTKEIAELMLVDSLGVLGKEAKWDHKDPIYTEQDVRNAMKNWEGVEYHKVIAIRTEEATGVARKEETDKLKATLFDSGHILGSAMVELAYGEKKILFTGDLGNSPAPLLKDTEIPKGVNYLVMESVYGDRNHEDMRSRKEMLEDVFEETIKKGGVLMIPAFSLERTQELLFELNDLIESGRIPSVPVFLDSPLAIKVTDIYKKYSSYFNTETRTVIRSGDDVFRFPTLQSTPLTEESKAIFHTPSPKVIIAGSGMSNGGRIVHHEKNYLPDSKNTLLLIGYQAVRTPGRVLQEGAKAVRLFGEEVPVNARVVTIHGYSAHKDMDGLFDFVEDLGDSLEKVFVVLGEPRSSLFLTQRLRDYQGIHAEAPMKVGESVELEF